MPRLAWVPLILLLGCGDETGDDAFDNRPYCDRDDGPYEAELAVFAAACSAMERCDLFLSMGFAFECRQECVQAFDFGLSCGLAEDDDDDRDRFHRRLEPREVVYDAERGAACIGWLESSNCSEIAAFMGSGDTFTGEDEAVPCQRVIETIEPSDPPPGTLTEGALCDYDECAEGLYCGEPQNEGDVVLCRACTALPGPGQPCRDYQCGAGAYCDSSTDPYMCIAARSVGSPCDNSQQCASEVCFEAACIQPGGDGAPCTSPYQCEMYVCYQGACLTPFANGTSCVDDGQCMSSRCYQGACIEIGQFGAACQDHRQCYYSCYRGTCSEARNTGDACDEDVNCFNSKCYANVCTATDQLPEGAPCTEPWECLSDRCVSGSCVTPRENGQPCSVPEECVWDTCFQGACGLPDGEACEYYQQCRGGRCTPPDRLCAALIPDGGACTYNEDCVSYTCFENSCITLGELDDPCTRPGECVEWLFCDPEISRCAMRRAPGEHCTVDDACYVEYCDVVASLCGHATGEACQVDDQCHGFCDGVACADPFPLGSTCQRDAQCIDYCVYGTCAVSKPYFAECRTNEECADGICDSFYGTFRCRGPGQCFGSEDCSADTWCDERMSPQVCVPKKTNGEQCSNDSECQNYCYSYCVEKRPFGSSCMESSECEGGLCEQGTCSEPGLCNSDADCTGGQICEYGGSRSHCIDKKPDGSGCQDDDECANGYCSDASETCKTRPKLGEACSPFECTLDAYCNNGTCVARKKPGSSCDPTFYSDLECLAPSVCRRGTCEKLTLECQAAPAGRMCTLLMVCAEDAYCDLLDGFTCKARFQDGQTCETVPWRANTCFDGSYCNTTCMPYAAIGEACGERNCDVRTSYCDPSTTCRAYKYQGEPCEDDSECLGDYCSYDGSGTDRCGDGCKPPG